MQEVEEAAKACVCHNLRKSSTITEISKEMYTDRTTLTRSLELLEKQAFIQIESSGDRRKRIVTITSKGKARMDKAFPLWEKACHCTTFRRRGCFRFYHRSCTVEKQ